MASSRHWLVQGVPWQFDSRILPHILYKPRWPPPAHTACEMRGRCGSYGADADDRLEIQSGRLATRGMARSIVWNVSSRGMLPLSNGCLGCIMRHLSYLEAFRAWLQCGGAPKAYQLGALLGHTATQHEESLQKA